MLKVIFEDDSLIVIDKVAGLVSTPAETTLGVPTLADLLETEHHIALDRGGLVHRLDKETSGLIIAAKTAESFAALQSQFKERGVKKEYLALVHGVIAEQGSIKGSILRNPLNREKFVVREWEGAREAETDYKRERSLIMSDNTLERLFAGFNKIQMRRLKNYTDFSLVRAFPKTGRTHQIRVHLKSINHPIVADQKYGGRKTSRLDARWCPRQFLHAARLEFNHPQSGERLKFESPLPSDLKEALSLLDDR